MLLRRHENLEIDFAHFGVLEGLRAAAGCRRQRCLQLLVLPPEVVDLVFGLALLRVRRVKERLSVCLQQLVLILQHPTTDMRDG